MGWYCCWWLICWHWFHVIHACITAKLPGCNCSTIQLANHWLKQVSVEMAIKTVVCMCLCVYWLAVHSLLRLPLSIRNSVAADVQICQSVSVFRWHLKTSYVCFIHLFCHQRLCIWTLLHYTNVRWLRWLWWLWLFMSIVSILPSMLWNLVEHQKEHLACKILLSDEVLVWLSVWIWI